MTWTLILFDGTTYTKGIFSGPHDRHMALKEATERFALSWPDSTRVVVLVPGDHPIYTH